MELEISHIILIYKREFTTYALMLYNSFDGFNRAHLQAFIRRLAQRGETLKLSLTTMDYSLLSSLGLF